MTSEEATGESSPSREDSVHGRTPLPERASNDIGKLEKEKRMEFEGARDEIPEKGVQSQR
jgi:hypothetical protein